VTRPPGGTAFTPAWLLLALALGACSAAGAQRATEPVLLPLVDRQTGGAGQGSATPNDAQVIQTVVGATQTRAAFLTAVVDALTATAEAVEATRTPRRTATPLFASSTPSATDSPTPSPTPGTPTLTATSTSTATATVTATATATASSTVTPTATPTRPPFADAAAGSNAAAASSFAAGHPPSDAVDLVGGTGSPIVQNEETFWQAGAAPAQGSESWFISFPAPGITLMAIQTRLYMPSAAPLALYLTLTRDTGAAPVPQTLLFDGTATDRQVVGTDFGPSGVTSVTGVRFFVTRAAVAPGFRTVGVYKPFGTASASVGVFAAIVNGLGPP